MIAAVLTVAAARRFWPPIQPAPLDQERPSSPSLGGGGGGAWATWAVTVWPNLSREDQEHPRPVPALASHTRLCLRAYTHGCSHADADLVTRTRRDIQTVLSSRQITVQPQLPDMPDSM